MDEKALFAEYRSKTTGSHNLMKNESAFSDLQVLENVEAVVELCIQSGCYNIYAAGKLFNSDELA